MSQYRRCSGACCQGFGLPSPSYLAEHVNKIENGDGPMIMRMLVPRGPSAIENCSRWVYDCRHFDVEKGECRVYDIRPTMCRDYPGLGECEIDGCTLISPDGIARRYRERTRKFAIEDFEKVEKLS